MSASGPSGPLVLKKQQHLKMLSAANNRWHFMVKCWCHLLVTFSNNLDPDQNVSPDLDPNIMNFALVAYIAITMDPDQTAP